MIDIKRNKTVVEIVISYHIPFGGDWNSTFTHECGSEHSAQMLYSVLRTAFDERIEKIRKEEYENGWKAKSHKKAKEGWFSCRM